MLTVLKAIKHGWILLSEKGSRLKMILAGTLISFAFMTPMMLGIYVSTACAPMLERLLRLTWDADSAALLSEWICTAGAYALTALTGVLITLPAYGCFFVYSWQTYSNTRYGFVDLVGEKKGRYGYLRNLLAGALLLSRPVLCFIILQTGYLLSRLISENIYGEIAIPMIFPLMAFWAVGIFVSILFLWLTNSAFFAPYYYAKGDGIFKAYRQSRELSGRYPFVCDVFSLIFGVAFVLSGISVGVLFILLILPLMIFTYFSLAEHLDGKKLLED